MQGKKRPYLFKHLETKTENECNFSKLRNNKKIIIDHDYSLKDIEFFFFIIIIINLIAPTLLV